MEDSTQCAEDDLPLLDGPEGHSADGELLQLIMGFGRRFLGSTGHSITLRGDVACLLQDWHRHWPLKLDKLVSVKEWAATLSNMEQRYLMIISSINISSIMLNFRRYYYAVVECDSSATANHLYNFLDGIEFLKTANILDLRFIPNTMEFKHPPRDIATEAPPDYKQPDFETFALQHSNVKLTWDDDEPDRKKTLRQKFNAKKSADASGADEDNDIGKEMEVTFLTGVENLSKHIDKNKLKKSEEGVWDAFLRKRREKMKAKKNRKFSSDEDTSDSEYNETPQQPDDFFVEEPSEYDTQDDKKGSKKGSWKTVSRSNKKNGRDSHKKDREEETREASRAELELLLADDDGTNEHLKGFNLRPKKAKGKKGKEMVPIEDKLPNVDANNDSRFSSRLTSHLFALDPTDPQYKRSATGMRQALVQKQQKVNTRAVAATDRERIEHAPDDEKPSKEKQNIMSLVRSLKLKSRALGSSGKSE
ncbi:hypothetical protein Taro_010473 [Colocasia esculenta]|uniref:NUC153 domain-containing protein n=1 Tax=Colocasia esculenta TaxID=4460 RepID=A0A843U3P0_COLES|nr:hypothetical protein [Colocasia esculenta]